MKLRAGERGGELPERRDPSKNIHILHMFTASACLFYTRAGTLQMTPEESQQEFNRLLDVTKTGNFPMNIGFTSGVVTFEFEKESHRDRFMLAAYGDSTLFYNENIYRDPIRGLGDIAHLLGDRAQSIAAMQGLSSGIIIDPDSQELVVSLRSEDDMRLFVQSYEHQYYDL